MVKLFLTASRQATASNQCCPQVFLGILGDLRSCEKLADPDNYDLISGVMLES